jgi:hypothetical protein
MFSALTNPFNLIALQAPSYSKCKMNVPSWNIPQDLKLSQQINALEFPHEISCVNVELKTNVSEISSASIIRVDGYNGRDQDWDFLKQWCLLPTQLIAPDHFSNETYPFYVHDGQMFKPVAMKRATAKTLVSTLLRCDHKEFEEVT